MVYMVASTSMGFRHRIWHFVERLAAADGEHRLALGHRDVTVTEMALADAVKLKDVERIEK